jgi:hypothetical protein
MYNPARVGGVPRSDPVAFRRIAPAGKRDIPEFFPTIIEFSPWET